MLSIVIGVLFGLLGALLVLGVIIRMLRGLGWRSLVLGFGLGVVVVLRVRGRLRFWFLRRLGSLFRFFLLFWFFFGLVLIRLLSGKGWRAREKKEECAADE